MTSVIDAATARELDLLRVAKNLGCALVAHFEQGRLIGWKLQEGIEMEKGNFVGKFMGHAWGDNEKNGNPYVSMSFMLVGGPFAGRVVKKTQAATIKTIAMLKESYDAMGWDGRGELPDLVPAQLSKLVLLDVGETAFERDDGTQASGFEVRFIRPVASVKKPISSQNRSRLSALLKGAPPPDADGFDGEIPEDVEPPRAEAGAS